eukprot:1158915-Pelagomonas_calceolata.AAC.1
MGAVGDTGGAASAGEGAACTQLKIQDDFHLESSWGNCPSKKHLHNRSTLAVQQQQQQHSRHHQQE